MSREPVPLRDALQAVGERLGMPPPTTTERVIDALRDVFGVELTAHARLRSLRDGSCVIEVDGPAWATRVRYLVDAFRKAANEACGSSVVDAVNVVVKPPERA